MVQIIRLAPQHWVADVIETAEYYRDVLGFSFTSFFRLLLRGRRHAAGR